ncbi:MAG: S9 family peptidase [Elusimicrobia bacterium]|nr:S9 family peptidase [Elusimicrobiota bacterium]
MNIPSRRLAVLLTLLPIFAAAADAPDPRLWLEQIESPRALAWVKGQDEKTLSQLRADPRWKAVEADARAVTMAEDRIPWPELSGGRLYNFWQDSAHVRGIWRRTTIAEYRKPKPRWETVLDLDALAASEKENWVWKGANCLQPEQTRCLITLSRGGGDAAVVREFDTDKKSFVPGGFVLPEAKSDTAWFDADTLLVGTDYGPGTLTRAGYPRVVKLWKRGRPLSSARTVYEGRAEDVSVSPLVLRRPEGRLAVVEEALDFFSSRKFLVGADGATREIPLPLGAELRGWYDGLLLASLRAPWAVAGTTIPAGALIALPADAKDAAAVETVWTPTAETSLQGVTTARSALYLSTLDDVQGVLLSARRDGTRWSTSRLPFAAGAALNVAASDDFSDLLLVDVETFLTPSAAVAWDGAAAHPAPETWRSLPARFDATGLSAEQRWAVSRDGTRVPYFLVRRSSAPLNGTTPTLLYGYGGFEISLDPYYLATVGRLWLSRGGAFALANIRGGGEFGPRWHEAALKEHRQRAFDDFEAVAEDLSKTKETSPRHLAIQGGSNGGLLVATVLTQRPELFGAVLCEVPLTDMLRYNHLLAGNSWVGEYGDPDVPAQAAYLRRYSPYQNVRSDVRYPPALIYSSTKDDRVDPGHARKFAARLEEAGQPVLYYENTEGGHSAAANLEQRVKRYTIEYTFLLQRLMP